MLIVIGKEQLETVTRVLKEREEDKEIQQQAEKEFGKLEGG